MNRVLVICNPFAGGGEAQQVLNEVKRFASGQQSLEFFFYETCKPKDEDGIQQAIEKFNPEIISIVGGDGTVNDVLNVQEARKRVFHLIPAGSGNDFQRLINGDSSIDRSIKTLENYKPKLVDIGKCNERYFLNGVGIGFDGSVARETVQMKLPFISSKWKYWIAIFKNIMFYRNSKITIEIDGVSETKKRFMVSVANGTDYGGGFKISPESDPSDGYLNLVSIGEIAPISRLLKIPMVQKGKHLAKEFVEHQKVKHVNVSSENELHAHLDGELMSSKRFEISVQPKMTFIVSK